MEVYSLTCITGNAGCYGVFSSVAKATEYALQLMREWEYNEDTWEETIWDGFQKKCYFGENIFLIEKTRVDNP
jgi:hypothetical protein